MNDRKEKVGNINNEIEKLNSDRKLNQGICRLFIRNFWMRQ
jgi:hypothetical protein